MGEMVYNPKKHKHDMHYLGAEPGSIWQCSCGKYFKYKFSIAWSDYTWIRIAGWRVKLRLWRNG